MEITDIIGKGKAFEPPFKTDRKGLVRDNRDKLAFSMENFFYLLNLFPKDEVLGVEVLAQHICDLLNRKNTIIKKEAI